MSFFDRLDSETDQDRRALLAAPLIVDALAGRLDRRTYLAFLTQAYYHVKHTVPLLMACGARLSDRCEWLRPAIAEYIEEEYGHQEWVLDDITACGGDAESVRDGRPSIETELMVAYAYDTIARGNPLGFFGMVFVLEGTSTAVANNAADRVQQSTGLPDRAFRYLRSHGSLDLRHVEFFKSLMNRVQDVGDQGAIVHAARVFYRLYGDIFRSLSPVTAGSACRSVA